jgi:aspartyl-tRNA(Asn)/glutamyl-tRNA(Gln) amidotransferase subunit B
MEIVSEPDLASAEEAFAYLTSLRQILVYGGVSDADMEKGQMRCDVNISVRPEGQTQLGAKIELKNLNSMSAVRRAIKFEAERQIDCLERGEKLIQSTRRWDDDRGETTLMRTKEDAHDYRYFPDPDLLPLRTPDIVARVRPQVPELPHEKRARFESGYGCSAYDAGVLASDKELASWYETAVAADPAVPAKKIANWVINDLLGALKDTEGGLAACRVRPAQLAALAAAVEAGKISNSQAKEVFAEMIASGADPAAIIQAKGFEQVSDSGALESIVDQILAANPDKVAEVKGGNDKAMNWFTGQAMKASQGKANPKMVTEIVRRKVLG